MMFYKDYIMIGNPKMKWELSDIETAEAFKELLSQNDDVNYKDQDGNTYLHIAAAEGREDIVKVLLAVEGIDVNAKNKAEETPLLAACERGRSEITRLLLNTPLINVNALNEKGGYTAFHRSVTCSLDIAQQFLKHRGLVINTLTHDKETALHVLCRAGGSGAINPSFWGAMLQLLLQQEAIDVNAKDAHGYTAIDYAVRRRGAVAIVEQLLSHTNSDVSGCTLLHTAIYNADTNMVSLLSRYQNVIELKLIDEKQRTPLHEATSFPNFKFENFFDANKRVIWAYQSKSAPKEPERLGMVNNLLSDWDIDCTAKDAEGKTALQLAEYNGYTTIVTALTEEYTKQFYTEALQSEPQQLQRLKDKYEGVVTQNEMCAYLFKKMDEKSEDSEKLVLLNEGIKQTEQGDPAHAFSALMREKRWYGPSPALNKIENIRGRLSLEGSRTIEMRRQ